MLGELPGPERAGQGAGAAPHTPVVQTRPSPHVVPSSAGTSTPQTSAPLAHSVTPSWHGSPGGEQETPAVQEMHAPPLHT
jgi:hypothetical protein